MQKSKAIRNHYKMAGVEPKTEKGLLLN